MPTFWDLPRPVREKIYRLRFVTKRPITVEGFLSHCGAVYDPKKKMDPVVPLLFRLCPKLEKDASHIYFRENVFLFGDADDVKRLTQCLKPHHVAQIRKAIVQPWKAWSPGQRDDISRENFKHIIKLKSLESLVLDVDEANVMERLLYRTLRMEWHESLGYGPQMCLKVLHAPGIRDLRALRGIRDVRIQKSNADGSFSSLQSSLPGGVLETIRREMVGAGGDDSKEYCRKGHFRFLDLPAELRNNIYNLLLIIPGVTYPLVGEPASLSALVKYTPHSKRAALQVPSSALDILLVNRQVHREAVKIFYHENDFVFSYPVHLQAFIISLEQDRLASLQNITLFYEERQDEKGGIFALEVTFSLLRRLQLRKFHLILPRAMMRFVGQKPQHQQSNFAMLQGAKTLFSLRGIEDIRILDPRLHEEPSERRLGWGRITMTEHRRMVKRHEHLLRHFNYGLQLAQKGVVVHELYTEKDWLDAKTWPALEGSTCSSATGCKCGDSKDDD